MTLQWANYYRAWLQPFGRRLWAAWCNLVAATGAALPFALGLMTGLTIRLALFVAAAAIEGYARGRRL